MPRRRASVGGSRKLGGAMLRMSSWSRIGRAGASMLRWPLAAASKQFISILVMGHSSGFTVSVTSVHALAPAVCNKEGSSAGQSWAVVLLGAVVGLCATTSADFAQHFQCAPGETPGVEMGADDVVPQYVYKKYGRYPPCGAA